MPQTTLILVGTELEQSFSEVATYSPRQKSMWAVRDAWGLIGKQTVFYSLTISTNLSIFLLSKVLVAWPVLCCH